MIVRNGRNGDARRAVDLAQQLVRPGDAQGGVAVVIDVLRASTTIVTALANGAAGVIPCGSPEDARRVSDRLDPASRLLGGERFGLK